MKTVKQISWEQFEYKALNLGYSQNIIWNFKEYFQNLLSFKKNLVAFKEFIRL